MGNRRSLEVNGGVSGFRRGTTALAQTRLRFKTRVGLVPRFSGRMGLFRSGLGGERKFDG